MKYSVRSSYHLVYSRMWKYDRKMIVYGIAEVIFSAVTPLMGVLMPSLIIACLEQNAGVSVLAAVCLGSFLIYGVIHGIQAFLENRSAMPLPPETLLGRTFSQHADPRLSEGRKS